MQLIEVLCSGVRGAENGAAELYLRGTSTRATYYSDFTGTLHPTTGADLVLDENGAGVVYVAAPVDVRAKDEDGTVVREFTITSYAGVMEDIGQSFTGRDYTTLASGPSKPVLVQEIFSRWKDSAGTIDWKVLVAGEAKRLQDAIGTVSGLFFNVKSPEYGALGDGATDDTTAIQSALDDAEDAGGGIVFFPPGFFRVTAKLTVAVGVSIWGCGANATGIGIDHATATLLEYGAGAGSGSYQDIFGVFLFAMQTNTGYAVSVTGAGTRYVRMVAATIGGSPRTGAPIFLDGSTRFLLDTATVTSFGDAVFCVDADQSTSTRVVAINSRFTAAASSCNSGLISAYNFNSFGCTYTTLSTSGTCYDIVLPASGATGPQAMLGGNFFTAGVGTTQTAMYINGGNLATTRVAEWGSLFSGTYAAPFSGFTAGSNQPQISSQTRQELTYRVAHTGTGALEVNADKYGMTVIQEASNSNYTINAANLPPEGAEWTLVFFNNSGGNSGTITYGTNFRASAGSFTTVTNQLYEVRKFRCVYTAAGTALVQLGATNHNV